MQEFDAYARNVEHELSLRWHGQQPLLSVEDSSEQRNKVLHGELVIRPGVPDNPHQLFDGLVHDWVGDVFMADSTVEKVLHVLQDFDYHSHIYPDVTRSRTLTHQVNHVTGYWRLEEKKQIIPVVLDAVDDAYYEPIAPGKWICRAYAKDIVEVKDAGTPQETRLAAGRGNGFLWRLYGYWSLEAVNGGVLAECRTLSLSRSIPAGLGWAVRPFIKSFPRDALLSTLRSTREAAVR